MLETTPGVAQTTRIATVTGTVLLGRYASRKYETNCYFFNLYLSFFIAVTVFQNRGEMEFIYGFN